MRLFFAKCGQDSDDEYADTFVLKTYETKEAEEYHNKEVSAFRTLSYHGSHPNIIGYLGSFTRSGTYNIILEYADEGTLEDYFRKATPPSSGEDVIRLWRGIFELVGALKMIHNVPRSKNEGPQFLQG